MNHEQMGSRPCANSDGSDQPKHQGEFYQGIGSQSRPDTGAAAPGSLEQDMGASLRIIAETLFEPTDTVEVRCIARGDQTPRHHGYWPQASKLHELAGPLSTLNCQGHDIFFGVNPRRCTGGSTNQDVLLARCLFADLDHVNVEVGRQELHSAGLSEVNALIMSGTGLHPYMRLIEPIHDLELWRSLQKRRSRLCPTLTTSMIRLGLCDSQGRSTGNTGLARRLSAITRNVGST